MDTLPLASGGALNGSKPRTCGGSYSAAPAEEPARRATVRTTARPAPEPRATRAWQRDVSD